MGIHMDTIHVNKISLSKCDVTINLYRKPSLRVNKKKLKKNTLGNRGSNDLNFVIQELESPRNDKYDHKCKEHIPRDVVKDNIVEDAEIEEEEQHDMTKDEPEAEEEDDVEAEEDDVEAEEDEVEAEEDDVEAEEDDVEAE